MKSIHILRLNNYLFATIKSVVNMRQIKLKLLKENKVQH
jgi:hypothetical protein